jgi:hypothetical protein
MSIKNYLNINVIILLLMAGVSNATTVLPEVRATVMVSKTDINRIECTNGVITSVDYAAGTGLIHKTHANGKNIILLFQQLDKGTSREVINSKVNILVGCNNEYYPLILDPQKVDSQTIHLQISQIEIGAEKNKQLIKQTREQVLISLIKRSRSTDFEDIQNNIDGLNQNIYINNYQLQLVGGVDIYGTNYQIKKFIVLSNNGSQSVALSEKQFISDKLSSFSIAALSLDDYELNQDKNWTALHVVIDKGVQND